MRILFAYQELKGIAADCEDRFHQIEKRIAYHDEEDDKRYKWKQSKEFVQAVEGFMIELEDRLVDFKNIKYKGLEKKADDILDFFYYKYMDTPLLSRMDSIREYFVDEYETLYGRELSEEEKNELALRIKNAAKFDDELKKSLEEALSDFVARL